MSQKSITEVKSILGEAIQEGVISKKTLQIIDINDAIIAGIGGIDADEIMATDVTLFTIIIDNTGSIRFAGLTDTIREGQNLMLNAFINSKQKDNILIAQWKLGDESELIHSYVPVEQAERLTKSNYNPRSGTALYDVWVEVLTANIAYAQKLKSKGTPVKSIVVVLTDGQDTSSRKYGVNDCDRINKEVLKSEQFIIAFVGVGNDAKDAAAFMLIAQEMGFPDGSILTTDATESELRKAMGFVSRSALRASQKAVTPSGQNSFFNP